MRLKLLSLSVMTLGAAALSGQVLASGYNFGSQSVSAQGTSHANGAEAADPTTLYYNPAGMSRLDGTQISVGLTSVVPDSSFTNEDSTAPKAGVGNPNTSGNNGGHFAPRMVTVPSLYMTHQIDNRFHVGLAVYVPYGAQLDYGNWAGRYALENIKLASLNINPSVSFKFNEHHAVALGVSAQHMQADLQKAVNVGALLGSSQPDGQAKFTASGWGYGFNLGYMYTLDEHTRFGLAYRSKIKQTLSGTARWTFNQSSALVQAQARALHPDSASSTDVTTPASASANFYHELDARWAVMGNVTWTGHSDMQNIDIKLTGTTQGDMRINQNWKDSWLYALGANYKYSDNLLLRTGVAYDQSPVSSDTYRHPALPDSDRYWLSLGGNYKINKQSSVDLAYSYVFFKDAKVNYTDSCAPSASATTTCTGNGETTKGTYKTRLQMLGMQYNYRF